MIVTISNLGDTLLTAVVEPFAEERSIAPQGKIKLRVDVAASNDFELVVGDSILSVYIPDGAGYAFLEG